MNGTDDVLWDMAQPTDVAPVCEFLNDDDDQTVGMWTVNTGGC